MAFWLSVSPALWAAAGSAELPEAPQAQAGSSGQPQSGSSAQPQAQALEITILDGEGALNNIRQRTAREPIVQVKDRNRKPVAGVLILFTINDGPTGAGGSIGGASTFSAVTDADGRAQIHGYTPNSTEGKFTITVTATLGAIIATAIIHQENRLGAASSSQNTSNSTKSKFHIIPKSTTGKVLLASAVAAGIVAIVLVATSGSKSGPDITAGAGSVTHP
jgi:hypothetical protein